jgi:DNA-binding SARP family transcriptional activator/Tfp pilus assembly protein PilF
MHAAGEKSIKVQLFGRCLLWRNGILLPPDVWSTAAEQALFKILVGERGRFFSQDELMEKLWPASNPETTAANLRRRVSEVRHLLEPQLKQGRHSRFILTKLQGYCFSSDAPCWVDAEEFASLLEQAREHYRSRRSLEVVRLLETAFQLYRGDYLDEDRYAEWAIGRRAYWREQFLELLWMLAESHAQLGQYRKAIALCRQLLRQEPYRESACRQLMLYNYLAGLPNEALHVYEEYVHTLHGFTSEPSPELHKFYIQIQRGHVAEIDPRYPIARLTSHELAYILSPGSVPFVGRQSERAQMVDLLEQVHQGQRGACVLISGEAGVGKTRFVQEMMAHARRAYDIEIIVGRCHELGIPYHPWIEIVRNCASTFPHEELTRVSAASLAEVANILPQIKALVPPVSTDPSLPAVQLRLRFFEGVLEFISALTEFKAKSMVLFLDDLHWADAASVDLFNFCVSRIQQLPILMLSAFRQEELRESHPLSLLVRRDNPKLPVHKMALAPLTAVDVTELLNRLPFKSKRPEILHGRLYKESGGNPFFLIAILQHFFEEGALQLDGSSWVTDIDNSSLNDTRLMVSPTIKELIVKRLAHLSEEELRLLRTASVLGHDFDRSVLERAYEDQGAYHSAWLGLVRVHLIRERDHRCEFSHDKIREVVYAEMSPLVRSLLHGRALRALEQFHAEHLEDWAAVLAQHAHQAGEWRKTIEHCLPALKKAVKGYRCPEGLKLSELGMQAAQQLHAAGIDPIWLASRQFDLLDQRVTLYSWLGRRSEHRRDLDHMEMLARRLEDRSKLALVQQKRSDLHGMTGLYREAEDAAREAAAIYQEIGDKQGQATCLNNMGLVCRNTGRYAEALQHHREALALRLEIGHRQGQAICLYSVGLVYMAMGQYREALDYFKHAFDAYQQTGDRRGQASCLNSFGIIHYNLGQYPEAQQAYRQAFEFWQALGELRGQADCLHNLGLLLDILELDNEALEQQQRALDKSEEAGYALGQAACLSGIARIHRKRGQYAEALELYRQARELFVKIGASDRQIAILAAEAMAYLGLGERVQALASSEQAIELLEGGGKTESPHEIYFSHYQILRGCGQETKALSYAQRAHDELLRRAEHIQDFEARERFLKDIKSNKEIIEVYQKTRA